jgi:four helix bundle protein
MAKSFRDLAVWTLSVNLATRIYGLTAGFPKSEIYGLTSQMRRAAVSIASNIAEGSARGTRKDFRQFVMIAKGSTCELQTQLLIAGRLGFAEKETVDEIVENANHIAAMLSGLSNYLSRPRPKNSA